MLSCASLDEPTLLAGLNGPQAEAVTTVRGPLLVLAGAGSGKTRVLIARIAHLISDHRVSPSNILGITFTRKAAEEMRGRLADALQSEEAASEVTLSTFHSLGARILREYGQMVGLEAKFGIVGAQEAARHARAVLKEADPLPPELEDLTSKDLLDLIGRTKAEIVARRTRSGDVSDLLSVYRAGCTEVARDILEAKEEATAPAFVKLYAAYASKLQDASLNNMVDYDDLIFLSLILFYTRPEVLRLYQDRWRYIHVDEYQDTDAAQDDLLRLLAGPNRNLCVVGDDDQAVYSWRGASVENILSFTERYAPCSMVTLDQNYRSTPNILAVANTHIRNRPEVVRHDKQLWTDVPEGVPVHVVTAMTQEEEALWIARDIRDALDTGQIRSLADVFILFRVNSVSRAIEDALRRESIPYTMISGTPLHEHPDVRVLLAYLRLAHNPADILSFERAIQNPRRGLGPKSLEILVQHARMTGQTVLDAARNADSITGLKAAQQAALQEFAGEVANIEKLAVTRSLKAAMDRALQVTTQKIEILDAMNVADLADDDEGCEILKARLTAIEDFVLYSDEYPKIFHAADTDLPGFLDHIATASVAEHPEIDDPANPLAGVRLMTVHASKGLESRRVYLMAVEERVFPIQPPDAAGGGLAAPLQQERLAEEARLFYVGVTRAREVLIITASRTRERDRGVPDPMMQSRFVACIPEWLCTHEICQ